MTKIGLLSDTHNWLDAAVYKHFESCDEIWHAGDFGSIDIVTELQNYTAKKGMVFKGVYGNIDGTEVRTKIPETQVWKCEGVTVYMTHIGGYPNRYAPGIKKQLMDCGAKLFICGHSHILKVMFDKAIDCLHVNPGAAGKQGWHTVRTLIRFTIDATIIRDCEVIELGKR